MRKEFKEDFNQWMDDNQITFEWSAEDCIMIDGFGQMYVFDSDEYDKLFVPKKVDDEVTMKMNIPIPIGELIDDEVYYTAVKWGECFYYIDLREEIELKILKYIGKPSVHSDFDYVNLGVHSAFELLNGSFLPESWVQKAQFYGHKAIGICDRNTLAGTFPLQKACGGTDMKFIFGYSLDVRIIGETKADEIQFGAKLYCQSSDGWANLLRIQKFIMVDHDDDPYITLEELEKRKNGICFVFDKNSSSEINDDIIDKIKAIYPDVYYQFDVSEYKANRFDEGVLLAEKKYLDTWHDKIPAVLICDNYYLDVDDAKNKPILNMIGKTTSQLSDDQYYKHITEHLARIEPLFERRIQENGGKEWYTSFIKEITENTFKIADSVDFRIKTEVLYSPEYEQSPEEYAKYKGDNHALFLDRIEDGFSRLVPKGKEAEYRERLEKEIYVIESTNNVDYFLVTANDCVKSGRDRNVQMGVGRGCFLENSKVSMANGTLKNIQDVKIGDIVKNYFNGRSNVVETHKYLVDEEIVELEFETGEIIKCTKDHKFYTKERGWVEADLLLSTDTIESFDSNREKEFKNR